MTAGLLSAAAVGGALLTYLYDEDASLAARLLVGACLGMAILGLLGFLWASVLGLTPLAVALAALGVASPLLLLFRPRLRARVRADLAGSVASLRAAMLRPAPGALGLLVFYVLLATLLWRVFDRAMFEGPDGIYTGVDHNLGDLPFHLAIINAFVRGENFPPEHPELSGARLTYPFLVDFVAAMLVRAGATLRQAVFVQDLVLVLAIAGLLHRWGMKLTGDRLAVLAVPLLVFLSGGLGFSLLFEEVRPREGGLFGLLRHLPHDYTILPSGLRWGNALTTLLLPQRSLLLGLPLFLVVWTLWWEALEEHDDVRATRRMAGAGAVAGLLPLAHAHSFAVALGMGACLALLVRRGRAWTAFFVAALALALPQLLWMARGASVATGSFVSRHVGWDRGSENTVVFWLRNTGVFIPVLLAALLWNGRRRVVPGRLVRFYLPFLLCFTVPNLLKLSPWIWDNIKFLFYWHLASTPLVALLLARLWRGGTAGRLASAALLLAATLSGALDVWRVASRSLAHRLFPAEAVAFAERMARTTPPRALILHMPAYHSPVLLTGRRSLLGYPGHIWSQGLDGGRREEDIKRIYAGSPDAEELLGAYGVGFIFVGPQERDGTLVDDGFLSRFPVAAAEGPYRLFAIRERSPS